MFLLRSAPKTLFNRRALSTGNPRLTVAQAALQLQAISSSTNEAELQAAQTAIAVPSTTDLPEVLAPLSGYLNSSAGATQAPYVPDPNAWQNLPFFQFVVREAKRPMNVWILIIGPA